MGTSSASVPQPPSRSDGHAPGRLARIVDASACVRGVRFVCRDSVTCGILRGVAGLLSVRSSWLAARLDTRFSPRGFAGAVRLAEQSQVLRWVDGLFRAAVLAWRHGAIKHAVGNRITPGLEPWQRVRLVGWVIVVGAITYALGNATVTPAAGEFLGPALAGAVGAGLMAGSRAVALALASRIERRSGDR